MFKNPFSFDGRIRRTEFGLTFIAYVVAALVINIAAGLVSQFFLVAYIPVVWFVWAQSAKRCHDRGNSGWWQLIPFYVLWMLFADGEPNSNEYGADPKGRGDLVESLLVEEEVVHA